MFIFLDESGDTGFRFRRGSSDFFVVSMVITEIPEAIDEAVRNLRDTLGYREYHEFKFSKSSQRVREEFLKRVSRLSIRVRTLIIDKRLMTQSRLRDQESFYEFVIKLLVSRPFAQISNATLVIDESDRSRRNQRSLAARIKKASGSESPDLIRSVKYWNSRSHGEAPSRRHDLWGSDGGDEWRRCLPRNHFSRNRERVALESAQFGLRGMEKPHAIRELVRNATQKMTVRVR